ncbi:sigma-54-dependent Fis family transcriptional regulator [Nitrogeniibacter mangrovi]|uniref:Sigma-54-dependent Fis family transcriptional regulator n=1 Tax=Nitrogeniibacter mangrovi TaxID=2016596 RepID=A0A6C1B3S3_9RHOO|nr:sigma-54-dependent Fis family transcriptional regulator [Nitrogeniibacter mangrovi]QID17498.1 sigma-54-dependent Fis family transcriptional regulator [Nitrogeniibacter mangrovi]
MEQSSDLRRLDQIERARRLFFERNDRPDSLIGQDILRSWERCRSTGLDEKVETGIAEPVSDARLRELRERNHRFLSHGMGIVESLYQQVKDSGSVVLLADATGMLLHRVGDPGFLNRADRVALAPGASWEEALRGTNAVGTAIVDRRPTEIFGCEHFMPQHGFLTCSATPVFDPHGALMGVLDISGDSRLYQSHTLGLVRMGAQLLERNLFDAEFASDVLVSLYLSPDQVGCVQEAVLAVSVDGQVLGASQACLDLLGVARNNLSKADFGMLFRTPLGQLIDRANGNPTALIALETLGGARMYARVRGNISMISNASRRTVTSVLEGESQATQRAPQRNVATSAPGAHGPLTLDDLRTGDMRMSLAIDRASRISGKDIPILIQGESGAGKEVFAKAFHFSGPRASGEFVALNCAAIPENLIESELFGYVGGAFTGARKEGAIGKIQQAHGGTLFLDEIGDMPLHLQARLLRVLQERSVIPVGGTKPISVDISLVCATHRTLRSEIAAGRFREDLYYRVNGLTVTLPTLRERSDLESLIESLLRIEGEGRSLRVAEAAMSCFRAYDWPGNIRQLHNTLRLAVALLDDDETVIGVEHLPEELFSFDRSESQESFSNTARGAPMPGVATTGMARLAVIERDAIDQALAASNGNISQAARRLGISRNTLYRKLGRL